jgi:hypothetical protein
VILTTHTLPEHLEALLDALLGFRMQDSEIIIINDKADRPHTRALQLLMDMHQAAGTVYIEHSEMHAMETYPERPTRRGLTSLRSQDIVALCLAMQQQS